MAGRSFTPSTWANDRGPSSIGPGGQRPGRRCGTAWSTRRCAVEAKGFAPDSPVTLTYHGERLGAARTNQRGEVNLGPLAVPGATQSRYYLIVSDGEGNSASANGLPSPSLSYLEANGRLYLYGQGYTPASRVTIDYHQRPIGEATTGLDGSFRAQVPYPAKSRPRYQLRATDSAKESAWATGVPAPSLRVTVESGVVRVIGEHFVPGSPVSVTYHDGVVARPTATTTGSFNVTFPLPSPSHTNYAIKAVDRVGRTSDGHRSDPDRHRQASDGEEPVMMRRRPQHLRRSRTQAHRPGGGGRGGGGDRRCGHRGQWFDAAPHPEAADGPGRLS